MLHQNNNTITKILALPLLLTLLTGCAQDEEHLALGTLERDRIALTATVSEIITAQPVAKGSHVQVGDLLVQFDTRLQRLAVQRLEAEHDERKANLQRLHNGAREEEIAAAKARVDVIAATLQENRLQLTRTQDLSNRGVEAQAEVDRALAVQLSNEARLRDAQAQLDLLRIGTRVEELEQAKAQLQSIQAQLALEQQKLADLSIKATRSGILDSLPFYVGERVAIGAEVAVLLSDEPPYARIYVPQTRRAQVIPGTELTVHVDGALENFTGRVRWIAHEPAFTPYYALNSSERSRLVYLAEVQLPDAAANLPAGLPVQVELP